MSYGITRRQERGAVSLFIVVFTALFIAIITVGFVKIMIHNQQQATQSDLSQSAYDSALAGVEDAKRALVLNKKCLLDSSADPICTNISSALTSDACNTLRRVFGEDDSKETKVQRDENSNGLDQAYTCAKVHLNTPDYIRKDLSSGKSHIIPLQVAPGKQFNKVKINWFTSTDAKSNTGGEGAVSALGFPKVTFPTLPADSNDDNGWGQSSPPLLRAQLIQTGDSFKLSDFDQTTGSKSDANTLFLYPSRTGIADYNFASDPRQNGGVASGPKAVSCSDGEFSKGGYACSAILTLPDPKDTPNLTKRAAYLRLSAIYTTTRYQVILMQDNDVVSFYNVQPEVDVTGRASDLFRRVQARIQLEADFPYPESALDLDGSLCKDFSVTSRQSDYKPGRCDPSAVVNDPTP